jgi:tRNA(Ile2) C34 agmatinyltransferase TiaS
MKTSKVITASKCCGVDTYYCPPSLGEEGFFVCKKCMKECNATTKEIETHKMISPGIYRPLDTSEYYLK